MGYYEKMLWEGDVRCHVTRKADIRFTDGALPHAMGVTNAQVMRSNQNTSLAPEGRGWTYAHAAMLGFWKGELIVQYLAGARSEHEGDSRAFLIRSHDGVHYSKPVEIFPTIDVPTAPYNGEGKAAFADKETTNCIIHHRMAFFCASNGRMLAMTHYGIVPMDPRLKDFPAPGSVKSYDMTDIMLVMPGSGYGVGRAVREIRSDFTLGPIHFLRYGSSGGYTRENTKIFPYYEESEDKGFVEACHELLNHRIATQQWWEEERCDDSGFFTLTGGEAPSIYTLPGTGKDKLAIMKNALTSISHDGGETWSPCKRSYSLETSTGKVWGQRTPDGRYALAYNPTTDTAHRWPLVVSGGPNGQDFGDMYAVLPEVPPCRYAGRLKNLGPQYIRGIAEYNPQPQDNAFYLTYSNNKEDIWISRVAVPLRAVEECDVDVDMRSVQWKDIADTWNLTLPSWGGIELEEGALALRDFDPYHRAIAERAFVPGAVVELETEVALDHGSQEQAFTIAFQDDSGREPAKVLLRSDGWINSRVFGSELHLTRFEPGEKIRLSFHIDCVCNQCSLKVTVGEESVTKRWRFDASVWRLCRVQFRTKYALLHQDEEVYPKWADIGNLPGADQPTEELKARIFSLRSRLVESN